MKIGEKIKELLEQSNITQRDLAATIGIDETTLSRIISGEREAKADTISNIATALHVTTDYLLDIEDNSNFDAKKEIRLLARNKEKITLEEKKN